jgi:hypothetical protein
MSLTQEQQQALKAKLSEFDLYFGLDKSGSMAEPHGKTTRWNAAFETLLPLTALAREVDEDGSPLVTFGSIVTVYNSPSDAELQALKDKGPMGSTNTAGALTELFKLAGGTAKKDLIVVLTDGVPDDSRAVEEAIIKQANSQTNDDDCTVLIVQLGDNAHATAWLNKLDSSLTGAKHDIVDVKTAADVEKAGSLAQVILDAIND